MIRTVFTKRKRNTFSLGKLESEFGGKRYKNTELDWNLAEKKIVVSHNEKTLLDAKYEHISNASILIELVETIQIQGQ